MWSKLSAGLQKVQDQLDQVLDSQPGEEEEEEEEGGGGTVETPEPMDTTDSGIAMESASHVTKTDQPASPVKLVVPKSSEGGRVSELKAALKASEEQVQLINAEYRKLLQEKEVEIEELKKTQLKEGGGEGGGGSSRPVGGEGGQAEVLVKELAAHKEMVSELRTQLHEKEEEFQELNAKAENKFNRLKAQAKTKIANLNREVEKLRTEKGDTTFNLSAQSLDGSMISGSDRSDVTEQLRSEVTEKEREVACLEEERERLREELAAMKDRLNVAEVCVQKEQDGRVKLELQATQLEEGVEEGARELEAARDTHTKLQLQLNQERENTQVLQGRVSELTSQLESQSEIGRNFSFGSSDMQVICETPTDRSGESSSPVEIKITQMTGETAVLAAEKGSLIDMESEILRLESAVSEQDGQLSSFKTVLEKKETELVRLRASERDLQNEQEKLAGSNEELRCKVDSLEASLAGLTDKITMEEDKNKDLDSENTALVTRGRESEERVKQLEAELGETSTARESFEKEVWSKVSEISTLSSKVEEQSATIAQKNSEIENFQQSVQELRSVNDILRTSMDGDKQSAASKLANSLGQIQELEERVSELQSTLRKKTDEFDQLERDNRELAASLVTSTESLQRKESDSLKQMEQLNTTFSAARSDGERSLKTLEHKLSEKSQEFQAALTERDDLISQREAQLVESKRLLEQLRTEFDSAGKERSEVERNLSKAMGALEFAEKELASRDETIKSLSQTLEEKKRQVVRAESQLVQIKSETADKLTEVMQNSEHSMQNRVATENELREVKVQLDSREKELTSLRESLQQVQADKAAVVDQLQVTQAKMEVFEKQTQETKVETETLRGQVETFEEMKHTFSEDRSRLHTESSQLKAKLSETSSQLSSLQQKFKSAKQQLSKALKERQDEAAVQEEMEAQISRYKKENKQMKEQFDSAVALMDKKSAEQIANIGKMQLELSQKDVSYSSLKDQLASEVHKSSELKEKVGKLTVDHKISSDRCRVLEQDKALLQRRVSNVEAQHSQLEHTLSDLSAERESLSLQQQSTVHSLQENESRVMDLTNQLAHLARGKEAIDGQLREVSRQLVICEQARAQSSAELEQLKTASRESGIWEQEKMAMQEERAVLERERNQLQSQLQSAEGAASAQLQLQASVAQLQDDLEACRTAAAVQSATSEGLQQKLREVELRQAAESGQLQRSLVEEQGRRQLAEQALEQLRGEVAIGLDDDVIGSSDQTPAPAHGEPKTAGDYLNEGNVWIQRLVKNPNIVLTRLLRATPQTKLFFLAYFVMLHLILLYVIVT